MSNQTTFLGVLFLEYNEEVKRIPFPSSIHSFQQVKSLFLKTFPDLTLEYLNLPFVKIYIQESTKSQIFYELDDLKLVFFTLCWNYCRYFALIFSKRELGRYRGEHPR